MAKTHYRIDEINGLHSHPWSACNVWRKANDANSTTEPSKVTCRTCRRSRKFPERDVAPVPAPDVLTWKDLQAAGVSLRHQSVNSGGWLLMGLPGGGIPIGGYGATRKEVKKDAVAIVNFVRGIKKT